MLEQGNRTFIGSVVFVDIVGYSKKSVSEQITMKDRFTGLLTDSLKDIAPEQRIILDTGDGAALSFLGDPEDALFVGMHMRDLIRKAVVERGVTEPSTMEEAEAGVVGDLLLRIGINLGPVKLIRDINGQPNIVGDGINVAQRIMSFAKPGQIVVSRSYFDVVSVISDEYAKLFKYEGSRTDKHVREHEIYVVGESDAAFKQAKAGMADRAALTNPRAKAPAAMAPASTTSGVAATNAGGLQALMQDRKKLMIAGGVLAAIVLVLLIALIAKKPADKTIEPAKSEVAKAETAKTDATPAMTPDAPKQADSGVSSATPPAPAATGAAPSTAAANIVADKKDAAAKPDPAKADVTKAEAPKPVIQGSIAFSIQPWGEVFINGKSVGVSPPMKQTKLNPGKYKIEVKNTTFTPHVLNVEVKPKEEISIKHKFQ
jgi:class 3 adenylate cyclase